MDSGNATAPGHGYDRLGVNRQQAVCSESTELLERFSQQLAFARYDFNRQLDRRHADVTMLVLHQGAPFGLTRIAADRVIAHTVTGLVLEQQGRLHQQAGVPPREVIGQGICREDLVRMQDTPFFQALPDRQV